MVAAHNEHAAISAGARRREVYGLHVERTVRNLGNVIFKAVCRWVLTLKRREACTWVGGGKGKTWVRLAMRDRDVQSSPQKQGKGCYWSAQSAGRVSQQYIQIALRQSGTFGS